MRDLRIEPVLFSAFLLCLSSFPSARADDSAMREPTHYAFIAGMENYRLHALDSESAQHDDRPDASFSDLLSACREAVAFRQSLLAHNWEADHIYPQVHKAGATETAEEVRQAVCDLSNERLSTELQQFEQAMLADERNPYGVVYVSAHGAESDGRQYIFGVDAHVNIQDEVHRFTNSTDYHIFQFSGVDILEALRPLNTTLGGHATLVLLDACRDNPVVDRLIAIEQGIDPAQRAVDYIRSNRQIPLFNQEFASIKVLFSTPPGREATGAGQDDTTAFSQRVRSLLEDRQALASSPANFTESVVALSFRQEQQQGHARDQWQIPDEAGHATAQPIYCFEGCPQPLSVWPNDPVRLVPRHNIQSAIVQHTSNARFTPSHRTEATARLVPVVLQDTQLTTLTEVAALQPRLIAHRQPLSLLVDVFYCTGDALDTNRENTAQAYADALQATFPATAELSGRTLGAVRLRALDRSTNHAHAFRRTGNSIWVSSDPTERAWGIQLASLTTPAITIRESRRPTPNYISAFFCEGANPSLLVQTVYTQVGRRAAVANAQSLLSALRQRLPNLNFDNRVEPVDDTHPGVSHLPDMTEVRYFDASQRDMAFAIAEELTELLHHPVSAARTHNTVAASQALEIWFGKNDSASRP